jgi:hypothetical protein
MIFLRARIVLIGLLLFSTAGGMLSAELRMTVKYVSSSAVYLDAGRTAGLKAGDRVQILRGDSLIAELEVTFVADNSASCQLTDSSAVILVGDVAVSIVPDRVESANNHAVEADTLLSTYAVNNRTESRSKQARGSNRLTGNIGLQVTAQDDREQFNYDYTQRSLQIRTALNKIGGSNYKLSVRANLRETIRNRETSSATNSATNHRLYEMALLYDNPDAALSYGAGRMLVRELRGIGYLDGAYGRYRHSSAVSAGVFAGTEPDLQNTKFRSDVTKVGAFAVYEKKTADANRFAATISLAGSYDNGEIDREFVYQQINYSHGSRLNIYESTEVNVNRGWLKKAENSDLKLASFLLNSRYAFSRMVALSLGYDSHTNYYRYESRSVPDSLFNDALRQGWRGSVNLRFTSRMFAEVGAGLRTTEGNSRDTRNGSVRLGGNDVFGSAIGLTLQVRAYENSYSKGYQPSITLSRSFANTIRAAFDAGTNSYSLEQDGEQINQHWLRFTIDASIADHIYCSADAEAARGSGMDANTVSAGIGYRF